MPGARSTPGARFLPGARSTPGARTTPNARTTPGGSTAIISTTGQFRKAVEGNLDVTFEKLAARMIAEAWYPVTYFRLNLGAADALSAAVAYAQERCGLSADASQNEIIAAVLESDDTGLRSKVRNLYGYVPYRLIRPFYAERFEAARANGERVVEATVNNLVLTFNRDDAAGAPYRFNEEGNGIEIDPGWARYFSENRHVVQGWLDSRLVAYLQARNPSVPAIPLKIYPPNERNLTAARKYWEEALNSHVFKDIYSGVPFDDAGFAVHGPMGVDHFIPWSFVLHDEPWNLSPMFRDANSSKGNRLPALDEYLRPFCAQQFDAPLTTRAESASSVRAPCNRDSLRGRRRALPPRCGFAWR